MLKAVANSIWGFTLIGIIGGSIFTPSSPLMSVSITMSVMATWLLIFCLFRHSHYQATYLLSLICFGFFLAQSSLDDMPNIPGDRSQGFVVEIDTIFDDGNYIKMRTPASHRIVIFARNERNAQAVYPGQIGIQTGPCKRRTNPITSTMRASSLVYACEGPFFSASESPKPTAWFGIRQTIKSRLQLLENVDARGVISALLLGDKQFLSGRLKDKFARTGTSHLLAVSGLHVVGISGLIYLGFMYLGFAMCWRNAKPVAVTATCLFALCLVLIADGPVGAKRAFITLFSASILALAGRKSQSSELLFFTACMLNILEPNIWRTVGFQLSFASVWGILLKASRGSTIVQLARIGFWTTITTAPIVVYHFGTLSLSGILTNLFAVPFVTLVLMPLAWAGVLFAPAWQTPLLICGEIAHYFICTIEQSIELGLDMWTIGTDYALSVLCAALSLLLFTSARSMSLIALTAGLISVFAVGGNRIYFLSVGQGDATLVASGGEWLLMDAGPETSGEHLLLTLRKLGVKRIDHLVISHQHPDHYAGLQTLIGRIPIKSYYLTSKVEKTPRLANLERQLKTLGTNFVDENNRSIGEFDIRLMWAPTDESLSENDRSIAAIINYKNRRVMVTGDREKKGENLLMSRSLPTVDVLRAGHHGSNTSTSSRFLNTFCPIHVVLSLGPDNHFGFPHEETVDRIKRHGGIIWRTDVDGHITIDFSNKATIGATNQSPIPLIPKTIRRRCQSRDKASRI